MNNVSRVHNVVVFKDDRMSPEDIRIAPATVRASAGDLVYFKNMTNSEVKIDFHGQSPVGVSGILVHPSDLKNIKNRLELTAGVGTFKYDAECEGKLARGSRPIIIIYDD